MIVRTSTILCKLIIINLILLFISSPLFATEPNSETDPYLILAKDRDKAETPLAYGFMIDISYPAYINASAGYSYDKTVENSCALPFELMFYIDGWQFSLSSKEYGNTARLMLRNKIVREDFHGYFFEIGNGWEAKTNYDVVDENGNWTDEEKIHKENPLLFGFGSKYQYGFKGYNSFAYYSEWVIGIVSPENENLEAFFYGQGELGAGIRIPINTMSLYIQGGFSFGFVPYSVFRAADPLDKYDEDDTYYDSGLYYGIQLKAVYNFSFNL